jgi:precorrin-2 dehydrogenase / sirohydrochlorin ferrochelatase
MRYYPIFLDLRGRRCVVVGGGRVAERRVLSLLWAKADVRVISPAVTPRLAQLGAKRKIKLAQHVYRKGELITSSRRSRQKPFLVFAATDDPKTQHAVCKDAEVMGALVNSASGVENSGFLVPATFRQGDLQVAISTSGTSPALARALRRQLLKTMGRDLPQTLRWLRKRRKHVLTTEPNQRQRTKILRRLAVPLTHQGHQEDGTASRNRVTKTR